MAAIDRFDCIYGLKKEPSRSVGSFTETFFLMCKNKMKIDGKERLSIADRTKLFKVCLTFSKIAVTGKSMLRKEFTVDFSQGVGIGTGAVKVEMFVSFFKQALREIFKLVDGFGYMLKKVFHYYGLSYLVFQLLTLFYKMVHLSQI